MCTRPFKLCSHTQDNFQTIQCSLNSSLHTLNDSLAFLLCMRRNHMGKESFMKWAGSLPKTIKGLVNSILPLGEVESNNEW